MIIVDTNIILRYLLQDSEELSKKAIKTFDKKLDKIITEYENK